MRRNGVQLADEVNTETRERERDVFQGKERGRGAEWFHDLGSVRHVEVAASRAGGGGGAFSQAGGVCFVVVVCCGGGLRFMFDCPGSCAR